MIKCLIIATIIVLLLVVQDRATLWNDPSGLQEHAVKLRDSWVDGDFKKAKKVLKYEGRGKLINFIKKYG